jgi:hypothetical protein
VGAESQAIVLPKMPWDGRTPSLKAGLWQPLSSRARAIVGPVTCWRSGPRGLRAPIDPGVGVGGRDEEVHLLHQLQPRKRAREVSETRIGVGGARAFSERAPKLSARGPPQTTTATPIAR